MTELLIDENKIGDELTPKQEMFCQLYAKNSEAFGNATLAYAEAYGYELEGLSKDRPLVSTSPTKYADSEYEKVTGTCASAGSKLLRNNKVDARIRVLLNELMTDEQVDAELSRVMNQSRDLGSKMRAISEYNKVKQRITEKKEINIIGLSDDQKQKLDQLLGTPVPQDQV